MSDNCVITSSCVNKIEYIMVVLTELLEFLTFCFKTFLMLLICSSAALSCRVCRWCSFFKKLASFSCLLKDAFNAVMVRSSLDEAEALQWAQMEFMMISNIYNIGTLSCFRGEWQPLCIYTIYISMLWRGAIAVLNKDSFYILNLKRNGVLSKAMYIHIFYMHMRQCSINSKYTP